MKKIFLLFYVFLGFYSISQIDPSDDCTGVPALTVGATCVDNVYALSGGFNNGALIEGACSAAAAGQNKDDGWYSFTANETSTTITCTGSRDFVLAAWPACGTTNAVGDELACAEIASGNVGGSIIITTVVGVQYFIQIH